MAVAAAEAAAEARQQPQWRRRQRQRRQRRERGQQRERGGNSVACDVVLYCSLERRLGLFFFKSYVASYGYVRRPGTDRISEEVKKKLRRNRNRDSCGKSATGTENTGIRRIPAGITNLAIWATRGRTPWSAGKATLKKGEDGRFHAY